ncbi:MAG: peptide chain release factor 1 [Akkermansiaceae bacterium]|nr:peptide chain release factor 1 [Akkermansiaceae bacterium]NNM28724.1 peptide chain release factor 1 [Akkermansiaceae bacterium]
MDYGPLIEQRRERLAEIERQIAEPDFYSDAKTASVVMREHRSLQKLLALWDRHDQVRRNLEDNRELAKDADEEMAQMAEEEIPGLEKEFEALEEELLYAVLPREATEDRDALVEIRAGAGGDEASLFAGELMRMYQRYAETRGWKCEHLESSPSEVGGFKEVVLKVSGEEVFRYLKYESGVHRVQRVPATETQGRIHTSTVTVAVLPEAEEVDIELKPDELNIQATRSGGPGGQHVNTTDSAVQITHLPSGIQVKCQDGRSQGQNKEKALEILRAKLFEVKQREEQEKYSAQRRSLIGSGDRSEKIRTYNFPQSRVTDHRVNFTSHNIEGILTGDLYEFTEALQKAEMEQRLAESGLRA